MDRPDINSASVIKEAIDDAIRRTDFKSVIVMQPSELSAYSRATLQVVVDAYTKDGLTAWVNDDGALIVRPQGATDDQSDEASGASVGRSIAGAILKGLATVLPKPKA